jgi:excisionase family DNA binding protein
MANYNNIPTRLAQKFLHDYTEAVKSYALDQKIELLEHLHKGLKAFETYCNTKDVVALNVYFNDEQNLLKKYGSHFRNYAGRQLSKYFNPETALLSSLLFTDNEFNAMSAEEQVLNDKDCLSFIWYCNNALSLDIKYLYLQKQPQVEVLTEKVIEKETIQVETKESEETVILSVENKQVSEQAPNDDYMNIGQLAGFLNCSKVTLNKYRNQGLPYFRIGRKILFKKTEVLDYMKNKKKRKVICN